MQTKVQSESESFEKESESFQAATVCFNEALDLLGKSNEGEKIKKDFTAILHVSQIPFTKARTVKIKGMHQEVWWKGR